jgi:hypothetical protein
MSALIALLIVLTVSLLITRLATAALMLTGVSHQLARLQALSALTGVGFTTAESERIVDHPARRRILILMMLVGKGGFVTEASALVLSFVGVTTRVEGLLRAGWLLGGLAALGLVASNEWVERGMLSVMSRVLRKWSDLEAYDYVELLEMARGYRVRSILVNPGDWVEGKPLAELKLFDEGVTVLGIHHDDGTYLGVPRGETTIQVRDRIVLYGRDEHLRELADRQHGSSGAASHRRALADHQQHRQEQQRYDEARAGVDAGRSKLS